MPTNRTPIHRRSSRPVISAEVLELYCRGREILAEGGDETWESEGGRRREYLDLDTKLSGLLRRGPWEVSLLDDLSDDPPEYMRRRNSRHLPDFNGWCSGRELQPRSMHGRIRKR